MTPAQQLNHSIVKNKHETKAQAKYKKNVAGAFVEPLSLRDAVKNITTKIYDSCPNNRFDAIIAYT